MINGLQMAAGGLGALAGTTPIETLMPILGWRGIFLLLAALTLFTSALIFFLVPEKKQQESSTPWRQQFKATLGIFRSRKFWRIAPLTMASQGTFLSIQSLWSGPWLRDVAGLDNQQTAFYLALIAGSMMAGFLIIGTLSAHLRRYQINTSSVAMVFMIVFIVVQGSLHLLPLELILWGWMAFGFFGTAGIVSYAALTQSFPLSMTGRVNTAMNFLVFVAAFIFQWGIGIIIQYSNTATAGYSADAYRYAFLTVLLIQVFCCLLYFFIRDENQV